MTYLVVTRRGLKSGGFTKWSLAAECASAAEAERNVGILEELFGDRNQTVIVTLPDPVEQAILQATVRGNEC